MAGDCHGCQFRACTAPSQLTQWALAPSLLPAVLMNDVHVQGERVTWAKLPAIQANCGIEMTLDACMLELSEVLAMKKQVAGLYRVARSSHGHHGHHHGQPPVLARMSPGAGPKMAARQRIPSWINLSAMGAGLFRSPPHSHPMTPSTSPPCMRARVILPRPSRTSTEPAIS